jgi:hypothetical protein
MRVGGNALQGEGGMAAGFRVLEQLPPDFDLSKLNLPKN